MGTQEFIEDKVCTHKILHPIIVPVNIISLSTHVYQLPPQKSSHIISPSKNQIQPPIIIYANA